MVINEKKTPANSLWILGLSSYNSFDFFLVNYSSFSIWSKFFLVDYSCSSKCNGENLVNYSYFGSCPRSRVLEV